MIDFHDLYIQYAKDIYRFAFFLCRDEADAEDITAETFSRVLTGKTPLVSATVKGYLFTIARNLYFERLRHKNRFTEISTELKETDNSLEFAICNKTELEDLNTYLKTFPEVDRTALMLKAEGMAYAEISEILSISIASAKVKVHRLRMKLAEWRVNREQKETKAEE